MRMDMSRKLEGKTAVITGANGGIGRAVTSIMAENGANIIACMSAPNPYEEELNQLGKEYDVAIYPMYFNLMNQDAIKEGIKEIRSLKIPIDILVNNAGIPHLALLPMTKMDDMYRVFQVNYFAQVQLTQGLYSSLTKSHGCVINMASAAGEDGEAGNTVYGATKASMVLFTKVLSKEMARAGVRVNAIAPGLTNTSLADRMGDSAKESMISTSLFHRLGTPEEIAKAVLFLASDDASFITGQVLRVDGGM